ncbi:hypothetical protein H696_04441 [Fonticula alba]|uniref:Uncharacterized protein n=1 Tax=Fonticula alba TaxID=691883 RepID=A0A058Z4I9_FONAL|nr:hypothetical protein H696_04441 [Fonticula alba]KCV69021.1 hypothetical protein H696_04441 [Fonticula alba]|eukprot:XP_009496592.1 hypothetical protein H696_04441 [Fonticula alba]
MFCVVLVESLVERSICRASLTDMVENGNTGPGRVKVRCSRCASRLYMTGSTCVPGDEPKKEMAANEALTDGEPGGRGPPAAPGTPAAPPVPPAEGATRPGAGERSPGPPEPGALAATSKPRSSSGSSLCGTPASGAPGVADPPSDGLADDDRRSSPLTSPLGEGLPMPSSPAPAGRSTGDPVPLSDGPADAIPPGVAVAAAPVAADTAAEEDPVTWAPPLAALALAPAGTCPAATIDGGKPPSIGPLGVCTTTGGWAANPGSGW